MINCPNLQNDHCTVATMLADGIPVKAHPKACERCASLDIAKTTNSVTCGLAMPYLIRSKSFDKDKHSHIVEGIVAYTFFNRPGTCLRNILQEIGIVKGPKCQCDEYASQMNQWGTIGCFERRDEIIEHLNTQYVSWLDMVRVALAGYLTTGQLVDESLKRSMVLK